MEKPQFRRFVVNMKDCSMISRKRSRLLTCAVSCFVSSGILFWTLAGFASENKDATELKQTRRKFEKGRVGPADGKKKPLFSRRLLVVDLYYAKGRVHTSSVETRVFPKRIRIPRFEGRFEARMYRNEKMLESLRFDFPLLGDAETFTRTGDIIWKRFQKGLQSRIRLRLPWDNPVDRVEILDLKRKRSVNVDLSLLKKHGMTLVPKRSYQRRESTETSRDNRDKRGGRDSKESDSRGEERKK